MASELFMHIISEITVRDEWYVCNLTILEATRGDGKCRGSCSGWNGDAVAFPEGTKAKFESGRTPLEGLFE
jgi:hypothetical protein